MNTDSLLQGHLKDLANKAYQHNIYTFTNFMSAADMEIFYNLLPEISFTDYEIFGGTETCDRVMLRFSPKGAEAYSDKSFPITTIKISPLIDKFSDELSHRDVLGAVMNLGIEREMIGDILLRRSSQSNIKNTAYLFCVSSIAEYIIENLTRIKHTNVRCEAASADDLSDIKPELTDIKCIAASERIDVVISAVTKLSRSQTSMLFREKKVTLNNRIFENTSYLLKPDDVFSVKGYGKFIYKGSSGKTRKGRLNIFLQQYI